MAEREREFGREARGSGRGGDAAEVVLPPDQYVYMQDTGKGSINTFCGPTVVTQQGTLQPVAFDANDGFRSDLALGDAVRKKVFCRQNQYVVLYSPAKDPARQHPPVGERSAEFPELADGQTQIIPDAGSFALWPGQHHQVVDGHNLRTDEFVAVRILDAKVAKENWSMAVVQRAEGEEKENKGGIQMDFTTGAINHVEGRAVKYFVPCTGMSVIKVKVTDEDGNEVETYIQRAMSLELLEYCILIDQNGKKRFEKGPQVVYPQPTETFYSDGQGNRKFRAIELNKQQQLHLKALEDFDDTNPVTKETVKRKAGDEWRVTGEDTPIYFPSACVMIIKYTTSQGEQLIHFATVVAEGEGRYVLDRSSGKIKTYVGPDMLLPDPTKETLVRRVLTERQSRIWFPGNQAVAAYNKQLREATTAAKGGYVTEAEVVRQQVSAASSSRKLSFESVESAAAYDAPTARSLRSAPPVGGGAYLPTTNVAPAGESRVRETKFNPPKTLVLDSGLDGAVKIEVWQGYAVCVVKPNGNQRVVVADDSAKKVILDYGETLAEMALSTNTPKSTDRLEETVYLQISGNPVGDIISGCLTLDHIPFRVSLSYRVRFVGEDFKITIHGQTVTGDTNKWWVDRNYVKTLTDRGRSKIRALLRRTPIDKWDQSAEALIRDLILGQPDEAGNRPGMFFPENSMLVVDVDIRAVTNENTGIAKLFDDAQHSAIKTNLELEAARRTAAAKAEQESLKQETAKITAATATLIHTLTLQAIAEAEAEDSRKSAAILKGHECSLAATKAEEAIRDATAQANLIRNKAKLDQEVADLRSREAIKLDTLAAETQATVDRLAAARDGFAQALVAISDKTTAVQVSQALSVQTLLGGDNLVEVLNKVFPGIGDAISGVATRFQARTGTAIPAAIPGSR